MITYGFSMQFWGIAMHIMIHKKRPNISFSILHPEHWRIFNCCRVDVEYLGPGRIRIIRGVKRGQ